MKNNYKYKPFKYWFLTLALTWIFLFTAAYFSYSESHSAVRIPFIFITLFTPFVVAMAMIYGSKNRELKADFKNRLFNFKAVKLKYWAFIFLIMPLVLILATTLSLLFGRPAEQFLVSPELTVLGGETFMILIILVLAPTFEELGFRGYGIESLKKGRSVIKIIVIYIIFWMLWHFPLYFIKGYYQNELFHENIIYALNFVVQLSVAGFLMGWVYYKNNRNIFAMIVFHVMLNLFSVLLQTEQFTKCIITVLLVLVSLVIFLRDKEFFYAKQNAK